ncbi:MAG: fructosamine kinase family protein, partial [Bacteroidota bacterium]
DPAVSYAHREMDIAMTYLFGGFSTTFYESYQAHFPLAPQFEERLALYQLYYLMVHVNLFGGSYVQSVRRILKRYV